MTTLVRPDPRVALRTAERVVVKVGSAVIAEGGALSRDALERLARDVAAVRARGCEVEATRLPQGPSFTAWAARLDRVLAFLLPRP